MRGISYPESGASIPWLQWIYKTAAARLAFWIGFLETLLPQTLPMEIHVAF